MDYNLILNSISKKYQEILKENLVGIYVHGSIAMCCFNWNKSDIDFLVVVNKKISYETKKMLMDYTIELSKQAPPKGLEMSVILKEDCMNFKYPTAFELHFSNMHIGWYQRDSDDYCNSMKGKDKDLAAHFTIVKHAGVVLCGEPISEVFGDVPQEDYLDSIRCDIKDCKNEIFTNPTYIVLNLCRVVAYIKDDLILSKEQGGKWGIENLDSIFTEVIMRALHSYHTNETMYIKREEANKFCEYMLSKIF